MISNWIEIKRLIKDNLVFIGGTSIVFAIVFTMIASFYVPPKVVNEIEVQVPDAFTKDSQKARFQLYIENEDGNVFTNNNLLIDYFTLESEISNIKKETGIDLEKINKELIELELEEEITPIHAYKDSSNGLIIITVNLGNERNNILVSNYIYNLFLGNKIGFLENKKIYPFDTPKLLESETSATGENTIEGSLLSKRAKVSTSKLIKNGLVGLVIGLVFSIGVALLKALGSKKLNYSFTYHVDDQDEVLLYDPTLQNEKYMSSFVGIPYGEKKLILSEYPLEEFTKNMLTDDNSISFKEIAEETVLLIEKDTLANVNVSDTFSEIIIIIKPYQTTKKWYRNQKEISRLYQKPVKIIQINK